MVRVWMLGRWRREWWSLCRSCSWRDHAWRRGVCECECGGFVLGVDVDVEVELLGWERRAVRSTSWSSRLIWVTWWRCF